MKSEERVVFNFRVETILLIILLTLIGLKLISTFNRAIDIYEERQKAHTATKLLEMARPGCVMNRNTGWMKCPKK